MATVTDLITYNLNDRGRAHRGKDRKFDIPAVVAAINSPSVQERVNNRDMHGYYGHWVRLKFGMEPREGGIVDGKRTEIEPAFITTYLKAYPDGTIEHKAEFLNNTPGKIAKALHEDRVGGFSSAIGVSPIRMHGFDYVLEPNYTTNRGYVLDSVGDMTDDEVLSAMYDEQLDGLVVALDSAQKHTEEAALAMAGANTTIERLMQENEQLMSILVSKGMKAQAALDSVDDLGIMPMAHEDTRLQQLLDASHNFMVADLPAIQDLESDKSKPKNDPAYARMTSRYLR